MKRILSLDGGGVRGIIQAYILNKIQKETRRPLWGLFDVIVGTSTGGLIALLIGSGFSGEEILEFYFSCSSIIFEKNKFSFGGIIKPKFSSSDFQILAENIFKGKMFSDMKTNIVCPAYCLDFGRPVLYRSFDSSVLPISCADLAVAISASPTYFKPKTVQKMAMIDGGVFMNNPAAEAAATAFELYGDDFKLLAIGNGSIPVCVPGSSQKNTGKIFWMDKIIDIMFDGVSDLADDQCSRILGNKFLRINSPLPGDINPDLADYSIGNIHKLIAFADDIWAEHKLQILGYFSSEST